MTTLTKSQLVDAQIYMDLFTGLDEKLPDTPDWGDGLHLILPPVIPLKSDFPGDTHTYAWLVANDFDGYDLTTTDPTKKEPTA